MNGYVLAFGLLTGYATRVILRTRSIRRALVELKASDAS